MRLKFFRVIAVICMLLAFPNDDFEVRARLLRSDALSKVERKLALSLALTELPELDPRDFTSNAFAFDLGARALGERIFFDPKFSRDGSLSCATCHDPKTEHASSRLVDVPNRGPRNPPSLRGVAWNEFFMSDGRMDSLWAQALGPLTSPVEHRLTFEEIAARVEQAYASEYFLIFGKTANATTKDGAKRVAVNVAKALAAFQMTLAPEQNTFDQYLASLHKSQPAPDIFGACAQRGLKVFLGAGRCVSCHNGPLLSNRYFHNTGVPRATSSDRPLGFFVASVERRSDPFRCDGSFSDARDKKRACRHVDHAVDSGALAGAFKTPSLRGISRTSPYMHNGIYKNLDQVIDHYDRAPSAGNGESELFPLSLDQRDKEALVCFLETL